MTVPEMIERDLKSGWVGCADAWWAGHAYIKTINSIAPTFTRLKQEGKLVPLGRTTTRSGGKATVWGWA